MEIFIGNPFSLCEEKGLTTSFGRYMMGHLFGYSIQNFFKKARKKGGGRRA
jgi:hypothetical protein